MRRSRAVAALTGLLVLLLTAPALGATTVYYVAGTGDSPSAACTPISGAGIPAARCDSLRSALAAANANVGADGESDVVFLQAAGTYLLAQAPELSITDDLSIVGRGPRTTTVHGNGSARVFSIAPGVTAGLVRLAVAGGRAAGEGGNILNSGSLVLNQARVTGGAASAGGGIANFGLLSVAASLIDSNDATSAGGGILNQGGVASASVSLTNTTVAYNRVTGTGNGGGIATRGNADDVVTLMHVTLARNTIVEGGLGAGISTGTTGETVSFGASIVANNAPANCGGPGELSEFTQSNVENGTTCGFVFDEQLTQLNDALSDQGGDTDVLTIPISSPAKNLAAPCFAGTDQRNAPRPASACDAGAYQQGATAPPIDSGPEEEPVGQEPPPTPDQTPTPTPVPTPTPTPTPEPTPEFRKTVVVEPVRGTVLVCPPRQPCTPLRGGDDIPMGSTIDTKKGEVELTSLASPGGQPQKARFRDGIFKVTQSGQVTVLTLSEALDCRRRGRASAAQRKPKTRKLWGNGKGKFRTKGQYSAATIRGTEWLVQDTCAGTLTRVTQGAVTVRDEVLKKTIVLRKGKRYTARPR